MRIKKHIAGVLIGAIIGLGIGTALEYASLGLGFPFFLIFSVSIGLAVGLIVEVVKHRLSVISSRVECEKRVFEDLPIPAAEFIKLVIKKMHYRKKVRRDVQAELAVHFEDELKDCTTDDEKEQKAKQLIAEFDDVKLLAVLLRRAKKRCRPLWRTIVARTFQTVGVLTLCLILYVAWFLTGKPVVTVDYVAELNRIVRPVADESLNAAPFYIKAAELVEEQPDDIKELSGKRYNEVTAEQKQLIEKWLSDNEEIFELVIAGTKKPYYWKKYEGKEMISILFPALAKFRKLAYSLRWKVWLNAEQGRYEDAFDDMKFCYRFGQHLKGDKSIIEQLVGIAIEAVAVQTTRDILSKYQIDSATLAKLQNDFEKMIVGEDFTVSVKTEKLFMYDEIQRCFTEDRFGGGHLYIPRLKPLSGSSDVFELILGKKTWTAPLRVLFTHPNKQESREMADRCYAFLDEMAHKTPAQIRAENIDIEKQVTEMVKGNILLEILTPAFSRIVELSHRNKANVEATLLIISLLRYGQDAGNYPESLGELVAAGHLKELPIDPWSDKPLVYKKTDDDFVLYSIGRNFTDDGGKVFRDEEGRVRKWADEGDWIFWPIQGN